MPLAADCLPFNLGALAVALAFSVCVHALYMFVCLPLALLCVGWVKAGRAAGLPWRDLGAVWFLTKLKTAAWFVLLFVLAVVSLPLCVDVFLVALFRACFSCRCGVGEPARGPLAYVWMGHVVIWLTIFSAAPPWV
jgi:hypothetical protein